MRERPLAVGSRRPSTSSTLLSRLSSFRRRRTPALLPVFAHPRHSQFYLLVVFKRDLVPLVEPCVVPLRTSELLRIIKWLKNYLTSARWVIENSFTLVVDEGIIDIVPFQ